jgi:hypothetical protein
MRQPGCNGTGAPAIYLQFNNAKVTNVSNTFSLQGDAAVTISMTSQIAGSNSNAGITVSGFGGF